MFRDDRGQSIQIGAVLLFGALVIALAGYQAFVVPQQNERLEFSHSQTVQDELQDLRNAFVSATGDASPRSVSVTLGTRYPDRIFAMNPGPPSGSLRTAGTTDPGVAMRVGNARATGETGDFWDGTDRVYSTGSVVYRPNYNVYGGAPTTVYEHSALVNDFGSGTVPLAGQAFIEGKTVTLVALNGSLDTTRPGTASVDVRPVSASTRTVSVTNASGSRVTLEFPTRFEESVWRDLLADQMAPDGYVESVDVVSGSPTDTLVVELTPGENYTLRLAKAGVGTGVTETDPAYLTDVAGNGSAVPEGGSERLVVEVRDAYNNPVSGVPVDGNASEGALADTTVTTDGDGRAVFSYDAPDSVPGTTTGTVDFSFGATDATNVTMRLDVQNTQVGSAGGSAPYTVSWDDPDGNSDSRYTFDVAAEGNTVTLTADVRNSTLDNATIDGADVDFAVNDSTVVTVAPSNDTSDSNGEVSTTLTAQGNGAVRLYATSGGASDYIDVVVENATDPQPGVVFADPSNGNLSTVDTAGVVAQSVYGVTGVQAAGPQTTDFAFDGGPEVPYLDGDGNLGIVDLDGNQRTLVSTSDSRSVSAARLAVGGVSVDNNNDYLTDTGPFVYFIDGNGEIARVDSSGTVETVYKGISAQAVAGTGDIDGDGAPELVYVDSNAELAYLDEKANGKAQERSLIDSPTLNTPNAVGAPADFDGDGAAEIPFIDGDTDVKYVNGPDGTDLPGNTTTLATGADNEGPVGAADRDGDSQFEIVYVDATNNDRLAYADPQDGTVYITDGAGNRLAAKPSTGAS